MINVTVIKGKDVIKYLVRIMVAIILIFILARYFCRFKETKAVTEVKNKDNTTLISCLEETIPQAKELKKQEENKNEESKEPIKAVLTKELGLMDAMTQKNLKIQKLGNNESSISLDGDNNKQNEKNTLENTRNGGTS